MPRSTKKSTTAPDSSKRASARKTQTETEAKPRPARTAGQRPTSRSKVKTKVKGLKDEQVQTLAKTVSAETLLDKSVFDEYAADIKSQDQQVSLNAIDRLGRTASSRATDLLIDCLKDSRYLVRLSAAAQLGERREPRAIESLAGVLHDESLFVRQTAARALLNIGGPEAMAAVKRAEGEGLLLDHLPEGKRLEPDDEQA